MMATATRIDVVPTDPTINYYVSMVNDYRTNIASIKHLLCLSKLIQGIWQTWEGKPASKA